MLSKKILIACLFILSAASIVLAQDRTSSQTEMGPKRIPPTLSTLYRHFLAYQLHLERKADELERQGKSGDDFRMHFQKVLRFSAPEFDKIHVAALDLEGKLSENDKAISKTVTAFRASLPKGPFSESHPPPAPPERLNELFRQRQSMVQAEIDSLHATLGKKEIDKLETFLKEDFSRSVTVGSASPQREHMPLSEMHARGTAQ